MPNFRMGDQDVNYLVETMLRVQKCRVVTECSREQVPAFQGPGMLTSQKEAPK